MEHDIYQNQVSKLKGESKCDRMFNLMLGVDSKMANYIAETCGQMITSNGMKLMW